MTWLKWWLTPTTEFNSGLMSPMSQVCHGWHHPITLMEMDCQAFLFVKLWVLWAGYHTGTWGPVQFRNPLETTISSTSSIFRKGTCGGSLVSPPSSLGPQRICPIMKQFASDQLGVKNSMVQQDLFTEALSILELPGTCRGMKCYVESGCCSRMQRPVEWWADNCQKLLIHSLVPKSDHPLCSERTCLYNYFFPSKLFANPLKSTSQN